MKLPLITLAAALLVSGACPSAAGAGALPNVVIILADDLGYGDVRAYNPQSKIATPNIDHLALQGIRFTDAHAAATCIPSRYELLTGRYLFRSGRVFEEQALIESGRLTIASLLKSAGYTTAMVGKWHLGFERDGDHPEILDYREPLRGGPVDHGFDSYFGIPASLDLAPYFYIENDRAIEAPTDTIAEHHTAGVRSIQGEFWRGGGSAPDFKHEEVLSHFTDRAVRYLESQGVAGSQQPFFLYLALTAPHPPWLPLNHYRGQSGAGRYGDFVMQLDEVVGRVVAALEKTGKANETLLIFASDNGPTWYEADVQKYHHRAAGDLRGMKADAWEAGHRVPFIARWPGKIPAGSSSAQLISFTDMFATIASLTAQRVPQGAGEDSFDLLPAMLGKASKRVRKTIIHEADGPDSVLLAIRHENWKLIQSSCLVSAFEGFGDGASYVSPCPQRPSPDTPQGQLYNLANDPAEQKNLYAKYPRIVKQLTELLERYRESPQGSDESEEGGGN